MQIRSLFQVVVLAVTIGGAAPAPAHAQAFLDIVTPDSSGDRIADDVLVYDPTLNGKVACNTFLNLNATAGKWYAVSDKRDPKAAASPLAGYLTAHPNTRIVFGGIHIAAGPGRAPLVA